MSSETADRALVSRFSEPLIHALIILFLLSFFNPYLLFLKTVPAGGDTPSHFMTALYLKEYLIPSRKIMGYFMGNYAGFPLLYHYFPLPFLITYFFSLFLHLEIAFKLVTVLGTFLLPFSTYLFFRFLSFERPVPVTGAILSLFFLFNEKNSMWGGNIPSTLSGEFAFSLSLCIFVVLVGLLFREIDQRKNLPLLSFLLALMCLSHGYTLIVFVGSSIFYLLRKRQPSQALFLLELILSGFGISSFWFIPFIYNLPWVTPFGFRWAFSSVKEILPPSLFPFFLLTVFYLFFTDNDRRKSFFVFTISVSLALYFVAPFVGLGDIRFLNFCQFFLTILCAPLCLKLVRFPRLLRMFPFLFFVLSCSLIRLNTTYIYSWIRWNYEGLEAKEGFHEVMEVFHYLRTHNDGGRVAYEHSTLYEHTGTIRIFELLPILSGRQTLEGVYMQSSISSPFVFYMQSEISEEASAPFSQYGCSSLDLDTASAHLSLFGVTQFIARSERVKREIRTHKEAYRLERRIGDYDIYRVLTTRDRLVTPCIYEPNAYFSRSWRREFYEWFKRRDHLDVPVVLDRTGTFRIRAECIEKLEKVPLCFPSGTYTIRVYVRPEEVSFETPLIGHPHIVKITYHPLFRVEGAKKIYLCAPSFMLVVPEKNYVKITFDASRLHRISWGVTVFSLLFLIFTMLREFLFKKGLH